MPVLTLNQEQENYDFISNSLYACVGVKLAKLPDFSRATAKLR